MPLVGEKSEPYGVSNPHPGFGKDDNIKNEAGHTEYPMYVHKFDEKGKVLESVILQSEDDEVPEGFSAVWVKPKAEAKPKAKPAGWDK